MKQLVSIIILAVSICLATHAFGAIEPSNHKSPLPVSIDSPQKVQALVFTGVIKKLDNGTALFTKKEVYPLIGGNFDTIVGKEVNIIGRVVKERNVDKIIVAQVQFEQP